ncbi:III [Polar bear adenovirus 1]|uniref:Penton protein n=1 Tax=Polar bear adenovirus 1 TaxID=2250215 RepID=A0A2Z4QJE8_9ADEN|nr:III [Polar bear adenovirus 1]AWY10560.1 penton [Polar bear adenovirus 1]AXI68654.1 III [Polar bear adenovirus 1]
MQRVSTDYFSPPPPYETIVGQTAIPTRELYIPPRYSAPSEGRNSIIYSQLMPLYDTTRLYFADNKSSDISALNYQNDHSNYLTSIIQNADYSPSEASTQTISFDDRSRWGANLKTLLYTNMPNINEFMFTNRFRVKLLTSVDRRSNWKKYEWVDLTIPEGNYSNQTVIELMNNAITEHYLAVGRQGGVNEDEIGVKIDTRNFRLGFDPEVRLITPGSYTYEGFHADIVLLPGCAIDFTHSRLNNLLGIRKRHPYQEGFVITYEDLTGGNIPGLMNVDSFLTNKEIKVVTEDSKGRSYHVGEDPEAGPTDTAYRSWFLAYTYGDPEFGIRSKTFLTAPDVTCGMEQLYWSFPDLTIPPVTFTQSQDPSNYPVVGAEFLPLASRLYFNELAVYSQLIRETTNQTHVFNRFPEHQILVRPPALNITSVSENVPAVTDHGVVPIKNNISGVQRVSVTDARRRICPYIYKSFGIVTPRVISSKTL